MHANGLQVALIFLLAAVITVPTIGPAAPNISVTGFHSEVVRKEKPNALNAGQPPIASETSTPASAAISRVAALKQAARNRYSSQRADARVKLRPSPVPSPLALSASVATRPP